MDIPVPAPQASTVVPLRGYQRIGVDFLVGSLRDGVSRAALLADDMGLGKSKVALEAAKILGCRRILIVAPAIGRLSWQIEIEKHAPEWLAHLRVVSPNINRPGEPRHWLAANPLIVVLSYDTFSQPATRSRWVNALQAHDWDLLILDECHYLKNHSARTHSIYGEQGRLVGLEGACRRVILLTGTPCPNHAGELYQHLRTFWPDTPGLQRQGRLLSEIEFQERFTRYQDTEHGRQFTGSQNQSVLREALGPIVLRRRRAEVLKELPPLQIQDVPLDVSSGERDALRALGFSRHARHALDHLSGDALLAELSQDEVVPLSTLRRLLGEHKAAAAGDWIDERLANGLHKILVFAWHTNVIVKLAERLAAYDCVTITGATSTDGRKLSAKRFQSDLSCRVLIGQIQAAGTSLTLTAASEVAIVEPSWTPGDNEQAIARAHRMGQLNPVLASFLFVPDTLDQKIMRVFRNKADEILQLYNKGERSHGSKT